MCSPHTGHLYTLLESILFRKRVEVKVFIALDHTNERKETIDLICDQRYPTLPYLIEQPECMGPR